MKKSLKFRLFCALLVLVTLLTGCSETIANAAVEIASEVADSVLSDAGMIEAGTLSGQRATATPRTTKKPKATPTPAPKATKKAKATLTPTPKATKKPKATVTPAASVCPVTEDGLYTAKEDVALYIYLFGHLPDNFITKDEAEDLGWSGGGLDRYAPGCSIGGDRFGNREGLLPKAKGRTYTECDIDTMGARSRGAKRIVFSNDGLIYYTEDHYESFTLLYGEVNK